MGAGAHLAAQPVAVLPAGGEVEFSLCRLPAYAAGAAVVFSPAVCCKFSSACKIIYCCALFILLLCSRNVNKQI